MDSTVHENDHLFNVMFYLCSFNHVTPALMLKIVLKASAILNYFEQAEVEPSTRAAAVPICVTLTSFIQLSRTEQIL